MLLSFNGAYKYYTYNCPRAFEFRVIDKVYPPKTEVEENPLQSSQAAEGILRHKQVAEFFTAVRDGDLAATFGEMEFDPTSFPFIMNLIDEVTSSAVDARIEEEFYTDTDYNPIAGRSAVDPAVYARPDLFLVKNGKLHLFDWKFGNPDWGASSYYEETEWFLAVLSAHYPDVWEFTASIHFPNSNYTLPERTYTRVDIPGVQGRFKKFFDIAMNRKLFFPIPATHRCRFCDFRSEEAGGIGNCEDSLR